MLSITTTNTSNRVSFQSKHIFGLSIALFTSYWIYGWFFNHDMENWIIENLLVILFLPLLFITRRWHQFSHAAYACFFLFLLLHCYGAFYAYTHNALGEWLKLKYHLWRNPYDRIVHFSFGFFIVYPARELLLSRFKVSERVAWLYPIEIAFSLGTIFEMIEWAVASCTDSATGDTYVATQGDIWDAHKDIMMAVLGAATFTILLYIIKKKSKAS